MAKSRYDRNVDRGATQQRNYGQGTKREDIDALHLNAQSGVVGGDSRFARFPIGNHPRKARPAFDV
jgi:hypothetical protein